jgi:hypothetical protein
MNFRINKYLVITLAIISFARINAQTFGFGCLGLSGFYAGYSKQSFEFPAVNSWVNNQIALKTGVTDNSLDQVKFQYLTGYRVGANLFRAKFSSVFITAKGYFQFLKQQQQVSTQVQNDVVRQSYQVSMNHWGGGVDFGTKLFSILDWKIVEGHLLLFSSELTQEVFINEVSQGEIKFSGEQHKLGYFLGSGLVFHIVPDYISVEGTIGYNFIQIDKLSNGTFGNIPATNGDSHALDKGTISFTLQLNIGFPL